ncbi:hypothetical protein [Streptomyces alanosinicus]|nr:hypothetical protein [Streptomyces alanosinicus]
MALAVIRDLREFGDPASAEELEQHTTGPVARLSPGVGPGLLTGS